LRTFSGVLRQGKERLIEQSPALFPEPIRVLRACDIVASLKRFHCSAGCAVLRRIVFAEGRNGSTEECCAQPVDLYARIYADAQKLLRWSILSRFVLGK